jgi:hypothetical protein
MAKFKIQKSSSTINWTGKKVLGLHTGSIEVANGSVEVENNVIKSGEIEIFPLQTLKTPRRKVISIIIY